ncbi:unnamed protein product [Echinostoma caproni]|uniref:PEST proteolytic signal-containing nuclear protein n=1 Tax=Echinostoma caproni TaxID=27848 RepID=A0A183BCS6_9TREM|nr:unnamed protein product [Echinostoma caproni]
MMIQQTLLAGSTLGKFTALKPKPEGPEDDKRREKKEPEESRVGVLGKNADNRRADGPPKTIPLEPSKAEGVKKMGESTVADSEAKSASVSWTTVVARNTQDTPLSRTLSLLRRQQAPKKSLG